MASDVEYRATLDDSQVLKSLRNIDKGMDRLAADGDKSFTKVGKSAKLSGVQIGAISGIVQELTRRFINMAEQAARALLEVAKGGIELNKSLELLEIRTTAILEGNQVAARAFLETARKAAQELRLDYTELSELAVTILPDAKDLEVSAKLAGQTLLLARAIGADARRAQISIVEALAGQYVSIRRVLNLSSQQIEKIKELEPAIGRAAAISEVLGARLEAIGFDAEKIGDSFTGLFGLIQSEAKRIQQIFAEPIFEELKEQAQAFLEVLNEHRDDIERVAIAFGQLVASVVELIGSNLVEFLDSIDYQKLEDTADALNDVVDALGLLIDVISGVPDDTKLQGTLTFLENIRDVIVTAAQAAALLKASLDALPAAPKFRPVGLIPGMGAPIAIGEGREGTVQERFEESLRKSAEAFELYNKRIEENRANTEKRTDTVEEDTAAALAEGQAVLDQAAALEALADAEAEAAEAREKLNEKLAGIAIDRERKLAEIYLEQGRKVIEDEIEFAQKREDIARENAQKIEDIYRDHQDDLADAARDLSRDEQDIARKAARDRVEVDRDLARERIDIETDYRRELERIRARFEESAAEAERRNDAQAFLEAMRQRDRDIEEAKRGRSEQIEDAAVRAAEQRQKVNEQLQYELEDARIANQRKLEDLQIRLDRELEAQRINYQRDLEEQALNEGRKREERARAYQQELEDFARKEAERLQDLNRSLATEFETIKKYEDLKRQERVRQAQQTVAEVNAALAKINPFGGGGLGGGTTTADRSFQYYYRGAAQRQEGGPVDAGRPYIVGERGPELFIPAMSGRIMPQVVSLPAPPAAQTVSNVSTTVSPSFNVAESLFNDPIAVRKLQNIVMSVLVEAL